MNRRGIIARSSHWAPLLALLPLLVACRLGDLASESEEPAPPRAPAGGMPPSPPTKSFTQSAEQGRWEEAVSVPDLTRADIGGMFPQAKGIALRLQPKAIFGDLVAFEASGGTVNFRENGRVIYTFEYQGFDRSRPPGKDKVEQTIMVIAHEGTFKAQRQEGHVIHSVFPGFPAGGLPDPGCTSQRAWSTATETGVPANAVATIHLYDNKTFSPKNPAVWSVRVAGHDEYRREIDAVTCAIVKRWDK